MNNGKENIYNGICLKLRNNQSLANILILNELLPLVGKSHQVNKREPWEYS